MGKLANQEEIAWDGISHTYRPLNLKSILVKYFQFIQNYKQLLVQESNSMSNSEIYFPLFSETIHIILKNIFTVGS